MKRIARKVCDPIGISLLVAGIEKEIGAGWMERIREKGFPGVNIGDLATGLGKDYERARILYRVWSWRTHARDSLSYVEPAENSGTIISLSPELDPSGALLFAALFYHKILWAMERRLRVGGRPQLTATAQRIIDAQRRD